MRSEPCALGRRRSLWGRSRLAYHSTNADGMAGREIGCPETAWKRRSRWTATREEIDLLCDCLLHVKNGQVSITSNNGKRGRKERVSNMDGL